MTNMQHIPVLILGAGITGLSIAHHLEETHTEYLVIEKEDSVGGMIRNVIDDDKIFSTSGHWLHFRNPRNRAFFESRVPLVWKIRDAVVRINDEDVAYPFQLGFTRMKDKKLSTQILTDFKKARQNISFTDMKSTNFEDFLLKRYGRTACEVFFFPYNRKLYGDLKLLSATSMGRFFPDVELQDIQNFANNPAAVGYNAEIGHPASKRFGDILNALRYDKNRVLLDTNIYLIDFDARIVKAGDRMIKYDKLVSTIPLKTLLTISGDISAAQKLEAASLRVFNVVVSSRVLDGKDWIYFSSPQFPFFRVGSYSNFFGDEKNTRLYVECPLAVDEYEVRRGLIDARIINSDDDILYMRDIQLIDAYNIINSESIRIADVTQKALANAGVLLAGRYGRWDYLSVEDCFEEGKKVAAELTNEC